ncbi:amino acid adenylation domain-containing protein [Streptomyces luteogriseus]|uniref:amino acid adenylation domain-containing protein n=1 Tax=Streptomyces luteogriseus TaxID=68233 RepID=UPI0037BC4523
MDDISYQPAPALQFPVRDAAVPGSGVHSAVTWDVARAGADDGFPALLLAAFAVLLHRYSGQDDLALTRIPAASAADPAARPVLVRSRIDDTTTVADMAAALAAERPALAGSGDVDGGLNAAVAVRSEGDVPPEGADTFDFLLDAVTTADGAHLTFHYAPARFTEAFVTRLAANFETLLQDAAARPRVSVRAVRLLAEEERKYLLHELNDTERPYPWGTGLHTLVEAQAALTPQAPAVEWKGDVLTYAELDARANQIARALRGLGIAPGSRVGVSTTRTQHTVTLLLGIHKAGSAYVPLDPAYPADRLRAIVTTAELSAVVTTGEGTPDWLHGIDALPIRWRTLLDGAAGERADPMPSHVVGPDDVTHLIYTSGSTGVPKGVVISHRNVVALLAWAWDTYSTDDVSRVLFATSLNFDLSVFELWVPLTMGGCVVVVDNVLALTESPGLEPSLVNTVPSALSVLLQRDAVPACTTVLNVAGEPLSKELVNSAFARTDIERLYNLYGPSEDTTYSTWKCFTGPVTGTPTIGVPIHNSAAYLLDAHGQLVPHGAVGELHLAGAGVSRGYSGDPERTAEVFVPSPPGLPAKTLYRTGDLARWTEGGELYFLGRRDHQVKVRGFRIELGEIESVVREAVGPRDVAVLAIGAENAARLVAYVARHGDEIDVGRIQSQLSRSLPQYMQVARIVLDDALPLLPNGKVDRKALTARPVDWTDADVGTLAPDDVDQATVAEVWVRLLGLERIGPDLDFFSIGGHSLLATLLTARLGEAFGVTVKVGEIYEHRTPAAQARLIRSKRVPGAAADTGTEARLREVARTLHDSARGHGVPGAGVAVSIDGEAEFTYYGFDDLEQRTPRTSESRQRITCINKALLAFVALRLVDRGLVGLDEPLTAHLPRAFKRSDGRTVEVTLRQLLSHTSGIDDSYEVWHDTDFAELESYIAGFAEYGQLFEPGEVFAYSACGTSIVAALIEKLLGMPWRKALNELMLVPLGIKEVPETRHESGHYGGAVASGYLWGEQAQAYRPHHPAPQTIADDAAGSFSICLTLGELAKIAQLALNDGVTAEGERLLSAELAEQMRTPQADIPGHHFMHAWGLGWLMFGPSAFGFNSNGSGHHNFIQIFPEQKTFLLLLANSYPVFGLYDDLLRSLTGKGMLHTDRSFDLDLRDCVGRYESSGYRIVVHMGPEYLGYAYAERRPDGSWQELDEGDLVLSGAGGFSSVSERNVLAGSISFIPAPGTRTPAYARIGQRFLVKTG